MTNFRLSSEPVIFLYTIISIINWTVLPQLVFQKICLNHNGYNQTLCDDTESTSDEIQKESIKWWFYMLTCSMVPSMFVILIWGPVADVIGRKKVMVVIPIVNALQSLVYLFIAYFVKSHHSYLLIGAFLSSLYGEFQGVIAQCYAYLADVTSDMLDQRTMRMALLEVAVFSAAILAGLLSGYLLHQIGFVAVFILNIGINVLILSYVVWCLPSHTNLVVKSTSSRTHLLEGSLENEEMFPKLELCDTKALTVMDHEEQTDPTYLSLCNVLLRLKKIASVICASDYRTTVFPLLCALGFCICALMGEVMVQVIYLKSQPFKLSAQMIGYYVTVQGTIRCFGVLFITQVIPRFIKIGDFGLILMGQFSQMLCYILIGVARSTPTIFLVNISGVAIPTSFTTLRSLVTKQVPKSDYGIVLAVTETTDTLATITANILSLWLHHVTLTIYSGIVYFGLSILAFIAFLVTLSTYVFQKRTK